MSPETSQSPCCPEWEAATERASDKESFGRAIFDERGAYRISHSLPALVYCPWCAARKRECPLCRGTGYVDSLSGDTVNSVPCPHCSFPKA